MPASVPEVPAFAWLCYAADEKRWLNGLVAQPVERTLDKREVGWFKSSTAHHSANLSADREQAASVQTDGRVGIRGHDITLTHCRAPTTRFATDSAAFPRSWFNEE